MAVFSFLLTAGFLPYLPSGSLVGRFALLSIGVFAILLWRDYLWSFWLTVALICIGLLALLAPDPFGAVATGWTYMVLLGAFALGRSAQDLRPVIIGAALGLWINSAVIIAQWYGYLLVPHASDNSGLFFNRNLGVEAAAMVVVALFYWRLWWLVPGLLPTFTAGARAPILALGVAAGVALWRYSRFYSLIAFLSACLVISVLWSYNPAAYTSIAERLNLWQDVAGSLTFTGRGLGSFEYEFPLYQHHTDALRIRFDHAHNDILDLIFQFGLIGATLVAAFLWRFIQLPPSAGWYAVLVFFVEGCFDFPLAMPVTGFLFAYCAGHAFGVRPVLRQPVPVVRPVVRGGLEDSQPGLVHSGIGSLPVCPSEAYRASVYLNTDARARRA